MEEYLAECAYGEPETYSRFQADFSHKLFEVERRYQQITGEKNKLIIPTSTDFVESKVKLKQLPDNIPHEIKEEIIQLFKGCCENL